eukprot:3108829-Rhodomonas_salina.3
MSNRSCSIHQWAESSPHNPQLMMVWWTHDDGSDASTNVSLKHSDYHMTSPTMDTGIFQKLKWGNMLTSCSFLSIVSSNGPGQSWGRRKLQICSF